MGRTSAWQRFLRGHARMQAGTVFRRRPQYDRKTAAVRRPAVARLTAAVAYGGSADFGCNGIVQDKKRFEVFPFREMSLHSPCSICTSERNPSHLISKIQSGWENGSRARSRGIGWKSGRGIGISKIPGTQGCHVSRHGIISPSAPEVLACNQRLPISPN